MSAALISSARRSLGPISDQAGKAAAAASAAAFASATLAAAALVAVLPVKGSFRSKVAPFVAATSPPLINSPMSMASSRFSLPARARSAGRRDLTSSTATSGGRRSSSLAVKIERKKFDGKLISQYAGLSIPGTEGAARLPRGLTARELTGRRREWLSQTHVAPVRPQALLRTDRIRSKAKRSRRRSACSTVLSVSI